MPNFTPIGDRVLIRRIESAKETPTGLIIPEVARDANSRGTIVAVGNGRRTEDGVGYVPIDFKVGDTVCIVDGVGDDIDVDGEKLVVMLAGDVLGVMEAR